MKAAPCAKVRQLTPISLSLSMSTKLYVGGLAWATTDQSLKEAFAKFGSDLDAATKAVIDKGKRNVEILKQPQYSPLTVEKQIAIIYLGTKGLLRNVAVEKVKTFESDLLAALEAKHPEVLAEFKIGGLSDDATGKVEALAKSMEGAYA